MLFAKKPANITDKTVYIHPDWSVDKKETAFADADLLGNPVFVKPDGSISCLNVESFRPDGSIQIHNYGFGGVFLYDYLPESMQGKEIPGYEAISRKGAWKLDAKQYYVEGDMETGDVQVYTTCLPLQVAVFGSATQDAIFAQKGIEKACLVKDKNDCRVICYKENETRPDSNPLIARNGESFGRYNVISEIGDTLFSADQLLKRGYLNKDDLLSVTDTPSLQTPDGRQGVVDAIYDAIMAYPYVDNSAERRLVELECKNPDFNAQVVRDIISREGNRLVRDFFEKTGRDGIYTILTKEEKWEKSTNAKNAVKRALGQLMDEITKSVERASEREAAQQRQNQGAERT